MVRLSLEVPRKSLGRVISPVMILSSPLEVPPLWSGGHISTGQPISVFHRLVLAAMSR